MQIRIVKDVPAGLKEGVIKAVPTWVGLKLIHLGYAVKYEADKAIERLRIEPITFKKKPGKPRGKDIRTAYMATFPPRSLSVIHAINSLIDQVDKLHVWCNDYTAEMIDELKAKINSNKLVIHTRDELTVPVDLGCTAKFVMCESFNGYVFIVDDDFICPPDYIETMIAGIEKYNRKAVVSIHGRLMKFPLKSYAHEKGDFYQCTHDLERDQKVHMLGTAFTSFHTDAFETPLKFNDIFTVTNMSDIHFAIELQKRGVPSVVLAHKGNWIKWINTNVSIAAETMRNDVIETGLINSIEWKI